MKKEEKRHIILFSCPLRFTRKSLHQFEAKVYDKVLLDGAEIKETLYDLLKVEQVMIIEVVVLN